MKLFALLGAAALCITVSWAWLWKWTVLTFAAVWLNTQLGMLVSEAPQPGYEPNMFGSYDHVGTRNLEIRAYRHLISLDGEEPYYRYLLAGSLMRCLNLDESERLYRQLQAEGSQYGSDMMIGLVLWLKGDPEGASAALERSNELNHAAGIPLTYTALNAFGNLHVPSKTTISESSCR